jgi:hypothetical protein
MDSKRAFLFLTVCSSLAIVIQSLSPVEVMVLAFGTAAPFGVPSISITGPAYEVAVEELGRKYNGTFNFTYSFSRAHSCLSVIETDDDILSKWYYRYKPSGGIIVFVNPGIELGKRRFSPPRN